MSINKLFYYKILVTKNLPNAVLTYSCAFELKTGQLVLCPIRNSSVQGVVLDTTYKEEIEFDLDKLQEITTIYNFILPDSSLRFLKIFVSNTFNNLGLLLYSILQSYNNLGKKELAYIDSEYKNNQNLIIGNENSQKLQKADSNQTNFQNIGNYELDFNLPMRIMDLIRIHIDKTTTQKPNILVLFPEKKLLFKAYQCISNLNDSILNNTNINIYAGDKTKETKTTTIQILLNNLEKIKTDNSDQDQIKQEVENNNLNSNKEANIYFATRAAVFLPFKKIDYIILVDEANIFYMQDQNSIYYDAREVVFWLQRVYQCSLTFLGSLPSSRLHSFDKKGLKKTLEYNHSISNHKPLNIKITTHERKRGSNKLFGPQIEALIDDEIGNLLGE